MADKKSNKSKKSTKPAKPEPEVELDDPELESDDGELEELEEDTVEETAPAGKGKKSKEKAAAATTVTFGASDLAKHINDNHLPEGAKPVDARGIRTLIRKMARDGSGRVNREIVPGNRTRYDWSGPNDPEVKKIIAAFVGGELEADKQEKLKALKDKKDAEKAADTGKGGKKKKKAKPEPEPVEEDDDEDLSLDDDDEDGDDE